MRRAHTVLLIAAIALYGCGGGGGGGAAPASPPPAPASAAVRISGASPFAANCAPTNGQTLYLSSAVEPYLAVSPVNSQLMVGVWQQDRWSGSGSRGILVAQSVNRGSTWSKPLPPPMAHCMGGTAANGGDYDRISDPWVAFSSDGATVYQSALAFTAGTSSAVLVSVSADQGQTWSAPTAVVRDAPDTIFSDKDSITADPIDPSIAYVVWDRSSTDTPAVFARTTDRGASWQPMQVLYDPGAGNATIGNVIVGVSGGGALGTMVGCLTQYPASGSGAAILRAIRSVDQGQTWAAGTAASIAPLNSVQTRDPFSGLPVRDGSIIGSFAADPRAGSTTLYAAWEDASPVSSQTHNAILLSRSTDGGASWSAPVAVNADLAVPAFDPSIAVRGDGEIGLTYYDFRGALATGASPVSVWLARSSDGGATWTESRIDGPFDLSSAPLVQGQLFLGDYQALAWAGTDFLPFYAKTSAAGPGASDVFFESVSVQLGKIAQQAPTRRYAATSVAAEPRSASFKRAVADNLRQSLMHRYRLRLPEKS
jgi:hypothetical protein